MNDAHVIRGPALRARSGRELFHALRDSYGMDSLDGGTDLGGSSNLNLLVSHRGNRFVVRVYRPWVTPERLAAIQMARQALSRGGVPTPQLALALDGSGWIVVHNRLVEVERFVEYDGKMDSWESLTKGLPWLGRVHTLMQPLELSPHGKSAPAANHVESEEAVSWTRRGTRYIRHWDATPAELRLADAAEELAARVMDAERDLVPHLPRQMVHGDFWDNNVLFRDGLVAFVTDLDFMGERTRIDDLALTLYYTNSSFPDDRASEGRIRRLAALVDAYDSGLERPLSAGERMALPLALARTPLCFIGMIASLDTEQRARDLAADMMEDIESALGIARDPRRWQEAFA